MSTHFQKTLQELRDSRFVSELEKLNFLEQKLLSDRQALNHQLLDIRTRRAQLQEKYRQLNSDSPDGK